MFPIIIPNDVLVVVYLHYHPNHVVSYVALSVFVVIDLYLIVRIVTQKAPPFMYS